MSYVLVVDKGGNPKDWADLETAVCYYAKNKVLWEIGSKMAVFRGGISSRNGERSVIEVSSVLGVSGPLLGNNFFEKELLYVDRMVMYARDKNICAYCGQRFDFKHLTIDHVLPKSRGGKNTWNNCVTACKTCNQKKGNRTPEEARMPLLYIPYAVNMFEKMILSNRKILGDQMEFLMARVPKNSRLFS